MNTTPRSLLRRFGVCFVALAGLLGRGAVGAPGPERSAAVDLPSYRTVLHVDQAKGDDIQGDGSSGKPFASLTHALEVAGRPAGKDRVAVLVSEGRYVQPTFVLRPQVDLYGGFASAGGARDIYAHATVLDGQELGRIAIGADDTRIDGFHFINGRVRGKGAALLCDGASPTVANCVFTNNRTLIPVPWTPPQLHETANDGGAIMCLNGAAPRIEHNFFYANSTECGRGGALASDRHAAPHVVENVFANNHSGLADPMRSGDGGAVSYFNWSAGDFTGNVVVANESLTRNDAGGVWVALWSSPRISDNVIVANEGGDDAGGLFIGGQEHRYGVPLDPFPSADKFNVVVERNVFVGNSNASRNSGAMRVTMESRAHFSHNLMAENQGGFYLQRSEITADHNTVWQDWCFVEDKPSLGPSRFDGNILKELSHPVQARVTLAGNMTEPAVPGTGRVDVADIFEADEVMGELAGIRFDPVTLTTILTTKKPLPAGVDFARRPITFSDAPKPSPKPGVQWRVIARASGNEIVIWGAAEPETKAPKFFYVLRTFTPKAGSPSGLGAVLNK